MDIDASGDHPPPPTTHYSTPEVSSAPLSGPRRVVVEEVFEDDESDVDESDLDDLGGPSDSEDESYIDAMEPEDLSGTRARNRSPQASSLRDNLPEHLQGLSIADILDSEWHASGFARGSFNSSLYIRYTF